MEIEEINLRVEQLKIEIGNLKNELESVNFEARIISQNLRKLNVEINNLTEDASLDFPQHLKGFSKKAEPDQYLSQDLKDLLLVEIYQIGSFTLHVNKRQLHFQDEIIALTRKELFLLIILAANQNICIDRDYCLQTVWSGKSFLNSRSMDVYICKLRKYLYKDNNINIVNKHKKGYLLHVKIK